MTLPNWNWEALGVISNIILVSGLVLITAYYAWQTRKQANIMYKNMEYNKHIRRLDQLREEMNKLVGPLYGKKGNKKFFPNSPHGSNDILYKEYCIFWSEIQQNIYLSKSDELIDALRNYIDKKKTFSDTKSEENRISVEKSRELLNEQIDARYDELKSKITNVEIYLKRLENED